MECTTLAIIDNHRFFRLLLKDALEVNLEYKVVYHSGSGLDFLEHVSDIQPLITIISMGLVDISGSELVYRLIRNNYKCRIVGMNHMQGLVDYKSMIEAGACSIVNFMDDIEEVFRAIAFAKEKFSAIAHHEKKELQDKNTTEDKSIVLAARERVVLSYLVQGYTTDQIASALQISRTTVNTHRKRLRVKAGVKNTPELVMYTVRHGIIA